MSNNPFISAGPATAQPMNTPLPGTPSVSSNDFEVDLTDVQDNGFIIPDGNYKVKCTNVEQTVSKSGNPMFVWDFEICEGDHTGFQSKVFTAITPAAMWKVAETVKALGVGQTGEVVKFKRTDVVGKICGAMFEQREYNGNVNSQISKILSLKELAESES